MWPRRCRVACWTRRRTARWFGATPDPLAPPHPHRPTEARGIVQHLDPPAMTDRDHPAVRTTRQILAGFDIEHGRAVLTGGHVKDVNALDTEQFIGPRTPPRRRRRSASARRVRQRQSPSGTAAWSPLILGALTPSTPLPRRPRSYRSTTLICEGPLIGSSLARAVLRLPGQGPALRRAPGPRSRQPSSVAREPSRTAAHVTGPEMTGGPHPRTRFSRMRASTAPTICPAASYSPTTSRSQYHRR